jgi:hypothetical protein
MSDISMNPLWCGIIIVANITSTALWSADTPDQIDVTANRRASAASKSSAPPTPRNRMQPVMSPCPSTGGMG